MGRMKTIQSNQVFELSRDRIWKGGGVGLGGAGISGMHTGLVLLGTAISGVWLLAPMGFAAGAAFAALSQKCQSCGEHAWMGLR